MKSSFEKKNNNLNNIDKLSDERILLRYHELASLLCLCPAIIKNKLIIHSFAGLEVKLNGDMNF